MVDVEVIAGGLAALRAIPERGAEVRLVRRLVLGEARVTIDPEHRLFHVHRTKLGIESGNAYSKIGDQLLEFLPQDIVGGLVPDEPGAVVVAPQSLQEFDQGGDVHGESGLGPSPRCTTFRPSAAARCSPCESRSSCPSAGARWRQSRGR